MDRESPAHEAHVSLACQEPAEQPGLKLVDTMGSGDVRPILEGEQHRRDVSGVNLKIDVDVAHEAAFRNAKAVRHRAPPSGVSLVEQAAEAIVAMLRDERVDHVASAVGAVVVDEDQLPRPARAVEDLDDLTNALREDPLLAVAGEDQAQVGAWD